MKELKLLSLVLVAGTATLFTACTSESDNSPSAKISYETIAAAQQVPVSFDTYIGETVTTRAGKTGLMDDTALKAAQGSGGGFGVFGFYTDGATNSGDYNSSSPTGGSPVNFMYNEGVFWSTKWEYSPVKYWPNETNPTYNTEEAVDGSATSKGGPDKLTFFAYAPYVSSTAGGVVTPTASGIIALTPNTNTGDPKVTYAVATDADETVDLLWAVAATDQTTPTVTGGTWNNVLAGKPFINLVKPKLAATPASTPINFLFKHALAKLTFSVQGAFDAPAPSATEVDGDTRIVIDNVEITSSFHTQGTLNLNNATADTPNWTHGGSANLALTINNSDIVAGGGGEAGLKYSGTDNYTSQPLGVTKTKTFLMDANGTTKFFTLIPESASLTIKITYHVYTVDTKLSGGFAKITNVISKTINPFNPSAGNWYNINMILGMETVSFTATVSPWAAESSQSVDLPLNVTTP